MNVVIAMAGRGVRLAGAPAPKPLVEVAGKPLFAWSTEWLGQIPGANVTVVALEEHDREFAVCDKVRRHIPDAHCLLVPRVTEGQLCTVLCAADVIDREEPLLIAPCDTVISGALPLPEVLGTRDGDDVRGIISVAEMPGDRWSFADCDDEGNVVRVAEKVRISKWASTGLYYFSSGTQFVHDARALIAGGDRVRGEFYVMPVYQRMLARGDRIKAAVATGMSDLGTPESLAEFAARARPQPSFS